MGYITLKGNNEKNSSVCLSALCCYNCSDSQALKLNYSDADYKTFYNTEKFSDIINQSNDIYVNGYCLNKSIIEQDSYPTCESVDNIMEKSSLSDFDYNLRDGLLNIDDFLSLSYETFKHFNLQIYRCCGCYEASDTETCMVKCGVMDNLNIIYAAAHCNLSCVDSYGGVTTITPAINCDVYDVATHYCCFLIGCYKSCSYGSSPTNVLYKQITDFLKYVYFERQIYSSYCTSENNACCVFCFYKKLN